MTKQSNNSIETQTPRKRLSSDYIRRPDGSWNVLPLVLGALVVAAAAYVFWGDRFAGQDTVSAPPVERTTK